MRKSLIWAVLLMIGGPVGWESPQSTAAEAPREPVPLIFDTDICGDCDDVLALGMIHEPRISRRLQTPGRHDQRRSRSGCPLCRCGQYLLRPRGRSNRSRRQGRRRRKESIPVPGGRERRRSLSLSSRLAFRAFGPERNGRAPQDPGGPARSLGRDRAGRVFDQPRPAP